MKSMYIAILCVGIVLTIIGAIGIAKSQGADSLHSSDNTGVAETTPLNAYATPSVRTTPAEPETTQRTEPQESATASSTPLPAAAVTEPQQRNGKKSEDENLSNKEKGNRFESYVADCFSNRKVFTVLEWNQGTTSSKGVYAENNVNPDFKIKHKFKDDFDVIYWVECKYKSRLKDDGSLDFNDYQLKRYRKFQRDNHQKIILAVGIGGQPDNPDSFFVIPLDAVKGTEIPASVLPSFALDNPHSRFATHIKTYFYNNVFKKH